MNNMKEMIMNELRIDRRDGTSDNRLSDEKMLSNGIGYVYVLESEQTEKYYLGCQIGSKVDILMRLLRSYDYYNISGSGYNTAYELLKYDDCQMRILYCGEFDSNKELYNIVNEKLKEKDSNCVNQKYLGGGGSIRVSDKILEKLSTNARKEERVEKQYNMLVELKEYKEKSKNGIMMLDDIKMLKNLVREKVKDLVFEQKVKREKEIKEKANDIELNDVIFVWNL